jgi:M6 family metalloprotease-like protein
LRIKNVLLILSTAFIFFCLLCTAGLQPGYALHPPSPGEIEKYKADGTYEERLENIRKIGNQEINPYLLWKANQKLDRLYQKAGGKVTGELPRSLSLFEIPDSWKGGLSSSGSPKTVVLLVDFPDYPHTQDQTVENVESKFFGAGDTALYPYESLSSFYKRSSYDKLNIQGDVLEWYRAQHERAYYEQQGDIEILIKEALTYYEANGHDFAPYDNDGDGYIDAFFLKWTGPDSGWGGFWWAVKTNWYYDPGFTVSGKKLYYYVSSWYSNEEQEGSADYVPLTDIHEMGHILGLPDYYDYEEDVGPKGGVGGLDIMDSTWGDHNCFSKFVLGWIDPIVVATGGETISLEPSGSSEDAVLIMPEARDTPFGWEFFMTQYRQRFAGNDPGEGVYTNRPFPADGLVIWHVDTSFDENGATAYDNSVSGHKLLRLMEADGDENIEFGDGIADAGDFYLSPNTFGPETVPGSNTYSGEATSVAISQLTAPGQNMSAYFTVGGAGSQPPDDSRFVLWSGSTQTSEVAADKEWRIIFNQEIDASTCTGDNIFICRADTWERHPVTIDVVAGQGTGNSVVTVKHEEVFESGVQYVLYLSQAIKSKQGAELRQGIRMPFSVASAV